MPWVCYVFMSVCGLGTDLLCLDVSGLGRDLLKCVAYVWFRYGFFCDRLAIGVSGLSTDFFIC